MKIKKAIFPVAGFGTRFLPATKATPKEMLPVIDKPIIQYAVEEAQQAGITEFIFVTHHAKRAIEDHFDENIELLEKLKSDQKDHLVKQIQNIGGSTSRFTFVRQDEPKGLGHAISCAEHMINENEFFAVILADDLIDPLPGNILKDMISISIQSSKQVLALEKVLKQDVSKFGIVSTTKNHENIYTLDGIVEKPEENLAPSDLAVVGRYIFNHSIFDLIDSKNPGVNGEIQITDAIAKDIDNFLGYQFKEKRFDCGSKIGYLKANIEFGLSDPKLSVELKKYLKGLQNL